MRRLPRSPAPYVALYLEAAMLAVEAQQVMALRMMRFWMGGAAAEAEAWRTISEIAAAATAAGLAAAAGMAAGRSDAAIARQAVRGYRKRVGANRRRLVKAAS
jgi:hypothetical protein